MWRRPPRLQTGLLPVLVPVRLPQAVHRPLPLPPTKAGTALVTLVPSSPAVVVIRVPLVPLLPPNVEVPPALPEVRLVTGPRRAPAVPLVEVRTAAGRPTEERAGPAVQLAATLPVLPGHAPTVVGHAAAAIPATVGVVGPVPVPTTVGLGPQPLRPIPRDARRPGPALAVVARPAVPLVVRQQQATRPLPTVPLPGAAVRQTGAVPAPAVPTRQDPVASRVLAAAVAVGPVAATRTAHGPGPVPLHGPTVQPMPVARPAPVVRVRPAPRNVPADGQVGLLAPRPKVPVPVARLEAAREVAAALPLARVAVLQAGAVPVAAIPLRLNPLPARPMASRVPVRPVATTGAVDGARPRPVDGATEVALLDTATAPLPLFRVGPTPLARAHGRPVPPQRRAAPLPGPLEAGGRVEPLALLRPPVVEVLALPSRQDPVATKVLAARVAVRATPARPAANVLGPAPVDGAAELPLPAPGPVPLRHAEPAPLLVPVDGTCRLPPPVPAALLPRPGVPAVATRRRLTVVEARASSAWLHPVAVGAAEAMGLRAATVVRAAHVPGAAAVDGPTKLRLPAPGPVPKRVPAAAARVARPVVRPVAAALPVVTGQRKAARQLGAVA